MNKKRNLFFVAGLLFVCVGLLVFGILAFIDVETHVIEGAAADAEVLEAIDDIPSEIQQLQIPQTSKQIWWNIQPGMYRANISFVVDTESFEDWVSTIECNVQKINSEYEFEWIEDRQLEGLSKLSN